MTVALALGGGAALGWAHIGVLSMLAEAEVAIGAVAGTSIGAIAAAAVASGRIDALEAIARGATRRRVFGYLDPAFARSGLLGGRRIARELEAHFGGLDLSALPIPAAVVAADLLTGEEVRIASGPVVPAVRASIAIPSLFAPVRIDGRLLIDGGMVANLPIAAARALAPALPIVAVDLMGDFVGHIAEVLPGGSAARPSALRVGRSAFLMIMAQMARQIVTIERPDVVIRPRIGHIGTGAFTRADELIALGRDAAAAQLGTIRSLAARKTGSR